MLCNAYDDMSSFSARSKHQRCYILELLKLDPHIQDVIQHLPLYDGKFDPKAYIDWELKVDNEFHEHDLSEKQKICIASNILIEYALLEWKHICRHNKEIGRAHV